MENGAHWPGCRAVITPLPFSSRPPSQTMVLLWPCGLGGVNQARVILCICRSSASCLPASCRSSADRATISKIACRSSWESIGHALATWSNPKSSKNASGFASGGLAESKKPLFFMRSGNTGSSPVGVTSHPVHQVRRGFEIRSKPRFCFPASLFRPARFKNRSPSAWQFCPRDPHSPCCRCFASTTGSAALHFSSPPHPQIAAVWPR